MRISDRQRTTIGSESNEVYCKMPPARVNQFNRPLCAKVPELKSDGHTGGRGQPTIVRGQISYVWRSILLFIAEIKFPVAV